MKYAHHYKGPLQVSVIIPVKNGAFTLDECLQSIREQTVEGLEIIVLDSASEDDSKQIACQYGAKIIDIPTGTFNHGLTRNIGVQQATGEYLFFTVQDAWLSKNDLLERMIKHFDNKRIMAVTGHQAVPHDKDKNPMYWTKRYSEPVVSVREIQDVKQFENAGPAFQKSLMAWDNVVSMYRKTALIDLPFAATEMAEDWIWSREALLKGWLLVHDPALVVYHYHHHTYKYAYSVAFSINYHLYKFLKLKPDRPALAMPLLRSAYHLGKNPELTLKEKTYWIWHNWLSKLGTFNAYLDFVFHKWKGGIRSVEKRYFKICKTIPQGVQK